MKRVHNKKNGQMCIVHRNFILSHMYVIDNSMVSQKYSGNSNINLNAKKIVIFNAVLFTRLCYGVRPTTF